MSTSVNDRFDAAAAKHHDLITGLIEAVKGQIALVVDLKAKLAATEQELEQLKAAADSETEKTAIYLEDINAPAQEALDAAKAALAAHASAADIGQVAVAEAIAQPAQ